MPRGCAPSWPPHPTRTVPAGRDGAEHEETVLTADSDGGSASRTVGSAPMGLNREFLLEALDAGGAGQLVLELDGPSPRWRSASPGRAGDVTLLMPIRLT